MYIMSLYRSVVPAQAQQQQKKNQNKIPKQNTTDHDPRGGDG